jgi:hypothetical protein
MTTAAETTEENDAVPCWCCGDQYPEDKVVHLDAHPEVAVCIGCVHYLDRRAKERLPTTAGARRVREILEAVRRRVIRLRLHEKPVVGPMLRWVDRHLP